MSKLTAALVLFFVLAAATLQAQEEGSVSNSFNHAMVSDSLFNAGYAYDPMFLIKGKVAGASISKNGGHPGVMNQMVIRGLSSYLMSQNPVYVIDGVIGMDPDLIFPENIESIEVLKDIASTAKYGSYGGNGIVLITTRQAPAKKKFQLSYSSVLSFDKVANRLDLLSAQEYQSLVDEYGLNFVSGGADVDWQEAIMQDAMVHSHSLTAGGNLKTFAYSAGVSYKEYPGVVMNSSGKKLGGNLHLSKSFFKNKLKFDFMANASEKSIDGIDALDQNRVFEEAFTRNPTDPIYEPDGITYYTEPRDFRYINPVELLNEIKQKEIITQNLLFLKSGYQINKHFKISVGANYRRYKVGQDLTEPPITNYTYSYLRTNSQHLNSWLDLQGELSYFTKIKEHHSLNASLSFFNSSYTYEGISSSFLNSDGDAPINGIIAMGDLSKSQRKWSNNTQQISTALAYDFKKRYFLNASLTQDMFSYSLIEFDEVEADNKTEQQEVFPSISAEWVISNEAFLSNNKLLSFLSLKAGYGEAGKQSNVYGGVEDIKYETAKEQSYQFKFGLLKNRITGTLNYYIRESDDLLALNYFQNPAAPWDYYIGAQNNMQVRNQGVEIDLHLIAILRKHFIYRTSFRFSKNKNEITAYDILSDNLQNAGFLDLRTENAYTQINQAGSSLFSFNLPEFAEFNADNSMLFYTEDGGVSREVAFARMNTDGMVMPKFELAWSNSFQIRKHLSLSFSLRYINGHSIYNANPMILNRTYLPSGNALEANAEDYFIPVISDYYLENATYIRLDNIVMDYQIDLGKDKKSAKHLNVFVGANNLITLTNYTGLDPEVNYQPGANIGIEVVNVYYPIKSFFVGVKLNI